MPLVHSFSATHRYSTLNYKSMVMNSHPPHRDIAYQIIAALCENGWEAYIVGGAARDTLNGETPSDYDIATKAPYPEIKRIFKHRRVSVVGIHFKVCLVDGIEVASYRKNQFRAADTKKQTDATLAEDLGTRDLTINALAFCPYNNRIIDYHGGIQDLKKRIIRFTADPQERIHEDPCRIIRACRFLAKFEGTLDPASRQAMKHGCHLVKKHVAPERIRLEILKALTYRRPSIFFNALHDVGVLADILPAFENCYGYPGGIHHGETIDAHLNLTGDSLPVRKPLLRLAGFLHDIGKPVAATPKNGSVTFIGHAEKGTLLAETTLLRLKFSLKESAYVTALIRHHMRDISAACPPKTVRRALHRFVQDAVDWKDWLQLKIADKKANLKKPDLTRKEINTITRKIRQEMRPNAISTALSTKDLALNGNDIMRLLSIEASPMVGKILRNLLEAVLDDPQRNTKETLSHMVLEMDTQ